jgi:hypothetical protein
MNLSSIQNNHTQFGFPSGVPDPPLYHFKTSPLLNMYESRVIEVDKMPGSSVPVPSWDLFKTVAAAFWSVVILLLGGLCFIVWNNFSSVREDVNTLRSEATGIRRDLSETAIGIRRDLSDARVEFTKAVGNVEQEIAATNGKLDATNAKLDTIASELQRARLRR